MVGFGGKQASQRALRGGVAALEALAEPGLQRRAVGRAVEAVIAQAGRELVVALGSDGIVGDRRHGDRDRERRERRGDRGRHHRGEPSHAEFLSSVDSGVDVTSARRAGDARRAEESAKTVTGTAAGTAHSSSMQPTVLVVEDEPDIVALLRDFLSVAGFGVLTAGDAAAAVEALDEQQVDCVLVDVMLPGSSGFELCRRIRESSDVPLLFLTARGDDSDKLRGLGLGADDYIVKSATPAEVVARVKAVLRRARRSTATPPRRTRCASAS